MLSTPLSDRLAAIVAGQDYQESILYCAIGQMMRLSLKLRDVETRSPVLEACQQIGIFSVGITADMSAHAQQQVLDAGIKAAQDWVAGGPQDSHRLGDAQLILAACERVGVLTNVPDHLEAFRSMINGQWDHPALMRVGPLQASLLQRAQQINDFYCELTELEAGLEHAPSNGAAARGPKP